MRQRSIRFRLTTWYSLALAAGLGLFALAIWASMRHSLIRDVDNTLTERANSVETFLNNELKDPGVKLPEELDEYSHAFPPNTFMRVKDERGRAVFTSPAGFPWQSIVASGRSVHRLKWQHHVYRVLVGQIRVEGKSWTVSVAAPLDATEQLLNRLRLLLIMLIPAVVAIATAGGAWLSRRALKPVDEITEAARSLGIENLSQRLAIPQTGDELQRLSETWNSMLSRLENAVNRLSRFTADASHELRTPLAVIRSTAEIANRRPRAAEAYRQALYQIASESERMTRLVEDLLFLARADADTLELPMSAVDLGPIVEDVCSRMLVLAESNAIRLEFHAPDISAQVRGNEPAIRRLVLVLVDNAIKYSRAGGAVAVRVRKLDRHVYIEIEDSGPGIPDSELSRIFERFYRAPRARELANAGSGLGLSLAASIAQHHGATIQVKSIPDKGSIFTVVFPSIPAQEGIPKERSLQIG
ncbi:MAG: heavy metal sensor histidine kinase [Acidobacteriaceae bacterium]|nr:heavy metal sensor histidine kinase [Acidobacteriaceae bacterium]